MESLKILIVEDEVLIAEDLKDLLVSFGLKQIRMAHAKDQAVKMLEDELPDAALLDIRMEGDLDGLEIAEFINKNYGFPFVFITSHSDLETIKRIVKVKPAAYLTKPFKRTDIFAILSLISEEQLKNRSKIMLKDGIKTIVLGQDEVDYIEGEGNYVNIFVGQKKIVVRQSLDSLIQSLDPEIYFRVHRSFIVNVNKIERYTKKEILFNDVKIPVSRSILTAFESKMYKLGKSL